MTYKSQMSAQLLSASENTCLTSLLGVVTTTAPRGSSLPTSTANDDDDDDDADDDALPAPADAVCDTEAAGDAAADEDDDEEPAAAAAGAIVAVPYSANDSRKATIGGDTFSSTPGAKRSCRSRTQRSRCSSPAVTITCSPVSCTSTDEGGGAGR